MCMCVRVLVHVSLVCACVYVYCCMSHVCVHVLVHVRVCVEFV